MEPDQQRIAEKEKQNTLQTPDEQVKSNDSETNDLNGKVEDFSAEPMVPESSNEKVVVEQQTAAIEIEVVQKQLENKNSPKDDSPKDADSASSEDKENSEKVALEAESKSEESIDGKSQLPSFPGTVTKSVPGSNDVKIEIDSNSLLDRVILYSLKNSVVDNSRLDAAKSKYMLNNGNSSSNFNSNSNESDSNSSNRSVEKLTEEFKTGCSEMKSEKSSSDATPEDKKSDISNESSVSAEPSVDASSYPLARESSDSKSSENYENVITSQSVQAPTELPAKDSPENLIRSSSKPKENLEFEALDFREKPTEVMLDLSIPHRDEKSVPPIKRNHALYVGLPDFSKQIFSAPAVSRPAPSSANQQVRPSSSEGPSRHKSLDFSGISRSSSDMQMRHLDFSKSFASEPSGAVPVTPSNFPEIVRKNNYITDLQLKPPSTTSSALPTKATMFPPSYKIDYSSSASFSENLLRETKLEQPSTSTAPIAYPNMKKEGINAYNQRLLVEEPMAHIIHKNQFISNANKSENIGDGGWADRSHGSSSSSKDRLKLHPHMAEKAPEFHADAHYYSAPGEDIRENRPSSHPQALHERNSAAQENHQSSYEFSLEQKEKQLRQEGTIITVKNELVRTPVKEINERRSADIFRDHKLKHLKDSPDLSRRSAEHFGGFEQSDYATSFEKFEHQPKVETFVKSNQIQQPTMSHQSYHSPSPVAYAHHQPKSPLTVPPGPSLMNPPQNWHPMAKHPPPNRHMHNPANMQMSSHPPPSTSHHPSQAQSSHMNYGYTYPVVYESTSISVNQKYQPTQYSSSRGVDVNRHYQPPTSTSMGQNYYHQKYPDFARHFDPEKKQPPRDPNMKYPSSFVAIENPRAAREMNYQRFPPKHEFENQPMMERPQYQPKPSRPFHFNNCNDSEREHSVVHHSENHNVGPPRQLNYEGQKIDSLKMHAGPLMNHAAPISLPLIRPDPSEVVMMPKVKIEPTRNNAETSVIAKTIKSVFAEVKRESPLDLSVKTVKTKADSTGCEQEMFSRHPSEPSGLKVEFTPNFARIAKTDCRLQARMGPQDFVPETSSKSVEQGPVEAQRFQKYPDKSRKPASASSMHQLEPQPQASSSRSFYQEQRFQHVNKIERPTAPSPSGLHSHQNRIAYPPDEKVYTEARSSEPSSFLSYPHKEAPRPDDKVRINYQEANPYYQQHRKQPPPAVVPQAAANKPASHRAEPQSQAQLNHLPPHPNIRNQLYYERARDRKYVEEILNRQNRKDPPVQPDMRHFHPIAAPPRKRVIEPVTQVSSAMPPKLRRIEEVSRPAQDPSMMHPTMAQHFELEVKTIGHPPALVTAEAFKSSLPKPVEPHIYPDGAREIPVRPAMHMPYHNSSYYPNPKAEMIHRSDQSNYKHEKLPFLNQNFQQRPDDKTLQYIPRIHHPIPLESRIKNENQPAGPVQETSGEHSRLFNGTSMPSLSGSHGKIARRADQSTILKLKTNLELKEQKRLIINKSEPSADDTDQQKKELSPRQFRTKGELKGFIPIPLKTDAPNTLSSSAAPAGQSAFDLLDWGSACNDFVQQLETGKKKTKKKRSAAPDNADVEDDKKLALEMPGTTTETLSKIPNEILKSIAKIDAASSSDEDKPLLELVSSQSNGIDSKRSHNAVVEKVSEKISRNMREKQRLELEQKLEARLGKPSSSESETDTRRPARTTKRVRRLRKRAALGIKKTDEELSVEEEETEEETNAKRRNSKSTSKLDDLTSSEDDKKKTSAREKKNNGGKKLDQKSTRSASKTEDSCKKQQSVTESSESDEPTPNKVSKLSSAKHAKKLKDLGVGSNIENLLEEEKTMTRSKRKLEIEKKLSNSKILRNEKVVQNVARGKRTKPDVTPNKKSSPKGKDSKADEKRKMDSDSDTNVNKGKKRQRNSSRIESSASSDESQVEEEEDKSER